jgi:hypothetical protein
MDNLLKLTFAYFHSEMDVILGAPAAFFVAVLVIAAIEYFAIKALNNERFEAQNARIEFLTRRLETQTLAQGRAEPRSILHHGAAERLAEKTSSEESDWPSIASLSPKRLDARDSRLERPAMENPGRLDTPGASNSTTLKTNAPLKHPLNSNPNPPQSDGPVAADIPAPRLDVGILNLHEGSRVHPVVELEVLSAIPVERLQAWVFSTREGKWYPQEPFWRNRGVLIATCHFGDENDRPGDRFKLSIIETQEALPGPIAALPRDLPQTKAFTLYRA